MLMVVFGAGASFDSVPSKPPSTDDLQSPNVWPANRKSCRPPLANQLFEERDFFAETLERYSQCLSITPYLRHLGKRQLEEVLEQLQFEAASYPPGHQQLAAVRYYLHDMLWDCGDRWLREAHGVTNYRTLLDEINRFRKADEIVSLVTFNYDMLLEPALNELGFDIKKVSDYVDQHRHYKVFKLHGSVNWGRVVGSAGLEGCRHDIYPTQTINRMINIVEKLQITESFVLAPGRPMAWIEGQPTFPAIAIPVQTKSHFECPQEHLDFLRELLPQVNKILIVGWRATERHLLELMANHLPGRIWIYIVAGSEQQSKETGMALERVLMNKRHVDVSIDKGGFTSFILERRAQEFLGAEYK